MSSTLSINPSFFTSLNQPSSSLHPHKIPISHKTLSKNIPIKAAASSNNTPSNPPNALISPLKAAYCAVIFAAAAFGKFPHSPARAEVSTPRETLTEDLPSEDTQQEEKQEETTLNSQPTQLSESNADAIEALDKLLQEKLDAGEFEESLSILAKISSAQPENPEWKLLIAGLLTEMERFEEARNAFEEVLSIDPLCSDALFETAILMDRAGEGEAAMRRLEDALRVAEDEKKLKEARDVKLIIGHVQFLNENVDKALRIFDQLAKEDPSDFRPFFYKGMIYSSMDRNLEASEQFNKFPELAKKLEAEGYLRRPLSRMELFGTNEGK